VGRIQPLKIKLESDENLCKDNRFFGIGNGFVEPLHATAYGE